MVGEDGFEPSKRNVTDLQSAPFGHSGTHPFMELAIGIEPTTCWLQVSCSTVEPCQHIMNFIIDFYGGHNRARTCDPLLVRQVLSQLSYAPFLKWWMRMDSNHRSNLQQIYSLPPLATRELIHFKDFLEYLLKALAPTIVSIYSKWLYFK